MRLTVLGGAAAGGNTGVGCSGYLVESGHSRLVLDLGPGTLPELRRHTDFRRLDAVVISHLHLDHVLDLLALRFALAYNPVPPPGRLPLWLPPGGLAFLSRAAAAFSTEGNPDEFFSRVFDAREFDPGAALEVGSDVSIRFTPTVHFVACWAMRISTGYPASDLVYTADTGPDAPLAAFADGARVLVAEGTEVESPAAGSTQRGHLSPTEAAMVARDAGVKILVLTHLWEEYGIDVARRQAAAVFAGRIEIARPGLHVEW